MCSKVFGKLILMYSSRHLAMAFMVFQMMR
jgi:hypothetical protein